MENSKLAVTRGLMDVVDLVASGFQVLRPSNKVVANHLAYFGMSQAFCKKAVGHMTGAVGLRRVPAAFLADAQMALGEQRCIVAKNEKQYTCHGVDVANLQRVLTLRVLVFCKPF